MTKDYALKLTVGPKHWGDHSELWIGVCRNSVPDGMGGWDDFDHEVYLGNSPKAALVKLEKLIDQIKGYEKKLKDEEEASKNKYPPYLTPEGGPMLAFYCYNRDCGKSAIYSQGEKRYQVFAHTEDEWYMKTKVTELNIPVIIKLRKSE